MNTISLPEVIDTWLQPLQSVLDPHHRTGWKQLIVLARALDELVESYPLTATLGSEDRRYRLLAIRSGLARREVLDTGDQSPLFRCSHSSFATTAISTCVTPRAWATGPSSPATPDRKPAGSGSLDSSRVNWQGSRSPNHTAGPTLPPPAPAQPPSQEADGWSQATKLG
ncbi:hypothetical protein AB0H42_17505 [Nocardia sp. NPDC050799]|uniref:hypothetical protein n=1 Tax=Nocardia sp. NPDC050799 TaxID=3154842 RepID=UPI0033D8B3F2